MNINPVRVRIAPSPTGHLHIGLVRTTLFNWLYAKKYGGQFIVRMEDTDVERSKKIYETEILAGLNWLGLTWDEGPDIGGLSGPYRQSERLEIYRKYLVFLLEAGDAYYCDCSKDKLEKDREEQRKNKLPVIYRETCRDKNIIPSKNVSTIIRFKMPKNTINFNDIIRGKLEFDSQNIGDFVIAKNLLEPLYNFAVVIDDELMNISHVIRGEDHLGNTPKQISLINALKFKLPKYAHIPLILNPDKSKMSKRHIETSIIEYKDKGFLSESLLNFIALLGWHPSELKKGEKGINNEIISITNLINLFELERVQKAGAVFNEEKLNWVNSEHIKIKDDFALLNLIKPFLNIQNLIIHDDVLLKAISILKDRAVTLLELVDLIKEIINLEDYESELLIWKDISKEKIVLNLEYINNLVKVNDKAIDLINLKSNIYKYAEEIGKGEVLWPLRVALSGRRKSSPPEEILEIIGQVEAQKRIENAILKLKK